MYNYNGNGDSYYDLVNVITHISYKTLVDNKENFYLSAVCQGLYNDPKKRDALDGILSLLDFVNDWMFDHCDMLVQTDREDLMDNQKGIDYLVKTICDLDYKLLREQREVLRALLDYDSSLWDEHKIALEGISAIIDSISDWMERNPEVIFDHKL